MIEIQDSNREIKHAEQVVSKRDLPDWLKAILVIGGLTLAMYLIIKLLEYIFSSETASKRRIFISHSWTHEKDFKNLISKLEKVEYEFYNHSVTKNKPLDAKSNTDLVNQIRKKMIYCSKIVVIAGDYVDKSRIIKSEIKLAKQLDKEIIAIRPWGQKKIPKALEETAHVVIGPTTENIISALQKSK